MWGPRLSRNFDGAVITVRHETERLTVHPMNPVLANAVLNEIAQQRQDAAARAIAGRNRSPFGGFRRRAAARRGRSPVAMSGPRFPARAGRA